MYDIVAIVRFISTLQIEQGIQSIPIVKSTQECEQEIAKDTGRLNVATCREKHAFVPFSRQDSGAITHSTQTLTYVKEYASRPRAGIVGHVSPVFFTLVYCIANHFPTLSYLINWSLFIKQYIYCSLATVQSRTSLKFEHSNGNGLSAMGDIENKLTTICDVTSNGVTPETPKMFTSLVLSMKSMSAMDMNVVYKKIKTLKLCSSNNKRVMYVLYKVSHLLYLASTALCHRNLSFMYFTILWITYFVNIFFKY